MPYKVGEAARENYVQTSYVNDVNCAYAETLMEYQLNGSATSIYEYGIQRLSYTDMGSGGLFTYLYDGRGSGNRVFRIYSMGRKREAVFQAE